MNVGDVNYYTHSSKTRCVFVDNKELPLISIDIWCKAGSSFEDVDKNGTAHFLAVSYTHLTLPTTIAV